MGTSYPKAAIPKTAVLSKLIHLGWVTSLCLAGALLATAVGCRDRQPRAMAAQGAQHLDFNQDVQPILASNCFSCHGPDPEMRKAGLRLDLEESAFRKRPGHPDAIVPGHPEQSELIKRIESKDPHYLMPQIAAGRGQADEGRGHCHPQGVDQGGRGLSAALGI